MTNTMPYLRMTLAVAMLVPYTAVADLQEIAEGVFTEDFEGGRLDRCPGPLQRHAPTGPAR